MWMALPPPICLIATLIQQIDVGSDGSPGSLHWKIFRYHRFLPRCVNLACLSSPTSGFYVEYAAVVKVLKNH